MGKRDGDLLVNLLLGTEKAGAIIVTSRATVNAWKYSIGSIDHIKWTFFKTLYRNTKPPHPGAVVAAVTAVRNFINELDLRPKL